VRRTLVALLLLLGALAPACLVLTDLDGLSGGSRDAGTSAPPSDAGADRSPLGADSSPDGAPARCTVDQPFDRIVRASDLDTSDDDNTAFLGPDELTAWVTRPNGMVLHERPSTQAAFAPTRTMLAAVPPITVTVSDDGLEALYWTNPEVKLRRTQRASTTVDFPPGVIAVALNPLEKNVDPYLVPGGGAVWLAAATAATDAYHLYRAERIPGGFGTATLVDTSGFEAASPVVDDGELAIYFGAYRPDNVGASDVFVMTRADVTRPFDVPRRVTELASGGEEWPRWLSRDRCRLYFLRKTTDKGNDLFLASRSPR